MTTAKTIFISYRRRTSIDITGRIYDRLATHFGENSVFKDVDSIPFGVNFRNHLEQEVSHCPVLLAVIDPHWLEVPDDLGRPKLTNPADWVRIEIETALQRDRLVIPVLVGGARLPDETALPEGLKALAYRQSAQVRCDPDFHRDMDRLIHRIEGVFGGLSVGGATGVPAPSQPAPSLAAPSLPTPNLIDELAAALATATKTAPSPPPVPPKLGRRRWLRLMGLSLLGGGTALAARQVPALRALAAGAIPQAVPALSTLPDRLQQAIEPADEPAVMDAEEPESEGLYTYESISVNEFGLGVSQVKFSTPAYQKLWLDGPQGPVALELVEVVGGQFVLGAPQSEPGHDPTQPAQTIATVESFWMSIYPITQGQWRAVALLPSEEQPLEAEPAYFTGNDRLPVEQVSWPEAVEFCRRLDRFMAARAARFGESQGAGAASLSRFRLPTEAEWEYACRAKTTTPFHTGQTLTTELANYDGTSPYRQEPVGQRRGSTTAVGSFGKANDFGLYDMHGNVLEWCTPRADAPASDTWRVVRGGSWQSPPHHCRSAHRAGLQADTRSSEVGFRLVGEAVQS